ncbi:hypothetical protein [Alcanivorax sp.]|uniref:hypothetical protein n=1 Tax=Alcanivorax sp. TaxID=1872427 RepID=UPI0032D90208
MKKTCRHCGYSAEVESALSTCPSCERVYIKTDAAYEQKQEKARLAAVAKREQREVSRVEPGALLGLIMGFFAWFRPAAAAETPLSMADLTFGRVFFLTLKFFIAWTVISWAFKAVMLLFALAGLSSLLVGMDLK